MEFGLALDIMRACVAGGGFCIATSLCWDVLDSPIGRGIGRVGNTTGWVMVGEDVRMGMGEWDGRVIGRQGSGEPSKDGAGDGVTGFVASFRRRFDVVCDVGGRMGWKGRERGRRPLADGRRPPWRRRRRR